MLNVVVCKCFRIPRGNAPCHLSASSPLASNTPFHRQQKDGWYRGVCTWQMPTASDNRRLSRHLHPHLLTHVGCWMVSVDTPRPSFLRWGGCAPPLCSHEYLGECQRFHIGLCSNPGSVFRVQLTLWPEGNPCSLPEAQHTPSETDSTVLTENRKNKEPSQLQ